MRRLAIGFFLLLPLGMYGVAPNVAGAPTESLAYVLDSAGQTVTAVDLASGKATGTVAVTGRESLAMLIRAQLDTLLLTSDGSRLVRLDPGAQKFTMRFGLHPQEKSTATIIDTKTMQVAAKVDLGWGLSAFHLTPDKKTLVTICAGYRSQKPEETLASEIVMMSMSTGEVLGRIELPRPPSASVLSKDGATAMLLYAKRSERHEEETPAEVQFVSVEQHAIAGKITLDGAPDLPVLAPTGDYLYLIEKGMPWGKPDKRVNGRVHVISIKGMKEETILDAGLDPKGVLADDAAGQTLLLSNGAAVKGQKQVDGELRVIRGAAIANLVKVSTSPQFIRLSPDRKRLYVVGWGELTAIDYAPLNELGRIPHTGAISELAFAPDGKRGYALHPESSKLSILDLEGEKPLASVTTGRGGIKFAKGLAAVAATAASATAAYGQAYNMSVATGGVGYAPYQVFTVAPANTQIAVKPDGAFVYVLNSQTNDVTVVNTGASAVVDKIAAGGRRLQLLNGNGVLAVVGRNSLHRIDTGTQKALPEITFEKNLLDLRISPDGQSALALVDGSVAVLNGANGEVRARLTGFKHPRKAVFAQEEAAPEPEAEEAATEQ
jgi:YVTN family beta-propeller protein